MLKKTNTSIQDFWWVDIDANSLSRQKIELYFTGRKCSKITFETTLLTVFGSSLDDTLVGGPGFNYPWWMFIGPEPEYNYNGIFSFSNVMSQCQIEGDYEGVCSVNDWKVFFNQMLSVLFGIRGVESLLFYNVADKFCFYLHSTCGVGIWYKKESKSLQSIISRALENGFEIQTM